MEKILEKLVREHKLQFTLEQRAVIQSQQFSDQDKHLLMQQAHVAIAEIGLGQSAVAAMMLTSADLNTVQKYFDDQVVQIVRGLKRVEELYHVNTSLETENFRRLLLTLAEDVRVVLVIIAGRVALMRHLNTEPDSDYRRQIAKETSFLYTPLAHRLGLYAIKTEFEDLSLKFTEYETYKAIAHALNEKKAERDAYIDRFIDPLKEKLEGMGFKFSIKGRTKSINSIYRKMQKQQTDVEHIYDLFAIRIILDSAPQKEKSECWQVYSVIADMYQPNPKRLRDWLTIPKSNGYESLHTTVLGPEQKWVEVQIRTRRMDEIAEKGVAAHWKYKGIRSDSESMDEFLRGVREMLENPNVETSEALQDFRLSFYDQEVFVFTPNGDLHKLPKGATVLDFAFAIHTALGCRCVGAKIGNRQVPIRHVLHNGDQVEIITSPMGKPSQQWLNVATTSKARQKIRQALKEVEHRDAADGKELIERRLRNWKLEYDDSLLQKLAKKLAFKTVSEFYQAIAQGKVDMLNIRDEYAEMQNQKTVVTPTETATISASQFVQPADTEHNHRNADVLVIEQNLKNVDYKLAKCCNPIYGDEVFGFVSASSGIKIHRADCPNALDMHSRYPYRIIPARWSGKAIGQQYPITLRVVGNDDIGIVTNITSLINKESGVLLRTISIDSHDGLFEGHLTLLVSDLQQMEQIRKKIATVRGVKSCTRFN